MMIVILAALAAIPGTLQGNPATALEPPDPPAPLPAQAETNLLPNGDMDQLAFYPRPPNHYVAGLWFEWWDGSRGAPEFINGGHPHHNSCYPIPADGSCADNKNKSQGYIRWGGATIAGIYQPVSVTPCQYYRFEIYNRNDEANYHPKIGIDPTGWQMPIRGDHSPDNCPPDGQSVCPDPSLNDISELPNTIVWSPEFDHEAYTWMSQSVTAEALSTTISVWTYTAPEGTSASQSSYWDYGFLFLVPSPNGLLVPSGALPAPDGGIVNVVTSTFLSAANVGWQTPDPAYAQVLYHYVGPASSASLPPIATDTAQFESHTEIDMTLRQVHAVRLDLAVGAVYDVALLSKRWSGSQCQVSVYTTRIRTSDLLVPIGTLPPPDGKISQVTSSAIFNSATLQWQTPDPSYSQVLYHYVGPISNPSLPPIVNDTPSFEFKTDIISTARTAHAFKLTNLLPSSAYDIALLACHLVNDQCQASAYTLRIQTNDLIVPDGRLPAPCSDITGMMVLPYGKSAYVIWQSARPAYEQVLYHYVSPIAATAPITGEASVYLPLLAFTPADAGSTSDYELKTPPNATLDTLHVIRLTGLITDSLYTAVGVSAWSENGQDKFAASLPVLFGTQYAPDWAADVHPAWLIEQLHICLAGGKDWGVCTDQLVR